MESQSRRALPPPAVNRPPKGTSLRLKTLCLISITLVTTANVVVLRYTRTGPGKKYSGTSAVFLTEILKFLISISLLYIEKGDLPSFWLSVKNDIIYNPSETLKLLIPSALYCIQNNLLYVALTHLDAATYQISYQLKILTTAVFSILLLQKVIHRHQWAALCVLTVGVILVQWRAPARLAPEQDFGGKFLGFICVLIATFTSGYAGVYYEKLVKVGPSHLTSIPLRNTQLGLFSIVFALFGMFFDDWTAIMERGVLHDYTPLVWVVILLLSTGGLLTAATVKYADNILKGFATSISIVLSSIISISFLQDLHLTWTFAVGTVFVIVATFLYGRPAPVCDQIAGTSSSGQPPAKLFV